MLSFCAKPKPIQLPGRHLVNLGILAAIVALTALFTMAAVIWTALDLLADEEAFAALRGHAERLRSGLQQRFDAAGVATRVVGVGPLFQVWFTTRPIRNYRDAVRHADQATFRIWWEEMLLRGVLFHPGPLENLFVSFAHRDEDVERTLEAADAAIPAMLARR